jgi:hypothetical protein
VRTGALLVLLSVPYVCVGLTGAELAIKSDLRARCARRLAQAAGDSRGTDVPEDVPWGRSTDAMRLYGIGLVIAAIAVTSLAWTVSVLAVGSGVALLMWLLVLTAGGYANRTRGKGFLHLPTMVWELTAWVVVLCLTGAGFLGVYAVRSLSP